MQIKGLNLPERLVDAISSGRWSAKGMKTSGTWMNPADVAHFEAIFFHSDRNLRPVLYGSAIYQENQNWSSKFEGIEHSIGTNDGKYTPGDIDPDLSILIGSTEPDCPIALDYRMSKSNPSVVYLFFADDKPYWQRVAEDINDLIKKLKI